MSTNAGNRLVSTRLRILLLALAGYGFIFPTGSSGGDVGQVDRWSESRCFAIHETENPEFEYGSSLCEPNTAYPATVVRVFLLRSRDQDWRIVASVWKGKRSEWNKKHQQIISTHWTRFRDCRAFVAPGYVQDAVNWGHLSRNMQAWWDKDGRKLYPRLCFVTDRSEADYVLGWWGEWRRENLQLWGPSATTTGRVEQDGTIHGHTTYNPGLSIPRTIHEITVVVLLTGEESKQEKPLFERFLSGGKADRDALAQALDFIAKNWIYRQCIEPSTLRPNRRLTDIFDRVGEPGDCEARVSLGATARR